MYCIKCGVELADSEKRCPLCGTPVFHPDLPRNLTEPPYPADRRIRREDVNRSGILFVLTVVALLPAILSLLCDWRINGTIVWSGYAAGAIGLLYVMIVLPLWFRHPNPVIFVPVDFAAIGLYLLYIDFATGNYYARRRMTLLFSMLDFLGIERERTRVEWVSAAEGAKFAATMNDFVATITKLGENRRLEDLRCKE